MAHDMLLYLLQYKMRSFSTFSMGKKSTHLGFKYMAGSWWGEGSSCCGFDSIPKPRIKGEVGEKAVRSSGGQRVKGPPTPHSQQPDPLASAFPTVEVGRGGELKIPSLVRFYTWKSMTNL